MPGLNKQLAIYGLGGVLNRSIGFLLIPLYTSFLSVADYGALALIGVAIQLISFVGLIGVSTASVRLYHSDDDEPDYSKKLYGNAVLILLVWPFMLFAALSWIGLNSPSQQIAGIEFYPLLFLVLIVGVFSPIPTLLFGLLRVLRRPVAFITVNLSFFVIQALLIIYWVALEKQGLYGQVLGQAIGKGVFFAFALVYLARFCRFHVDKDLMWQLLRFGIPLVPFFVFAWINTSAGRVFVQHNLDLESVGIFFLAAQFGGILNLVSTALNNAFAPHFYRVAREQGGQAELGDLVTKYVVLFSLFALFLVAVVPHVVRLVATEDYYESIQYIAPLILANLTYTFSSPIGWSMTFSKQTATLSLVRILATVFLLMLLAVQAWWGVFSIYSVVASMIAANTFMLVVGGIQAQKYFVLFLNAKKLVGVLLLFAILGVLISHVTLQMAWVVSIPVVSVLFWIACRIGFRAANIRLSAVRFS